MVSVTDTLITDSKDYQLFWSLEIKFAGAKCQLLSILYLGIFVWLLSRLQNDSLSPFWPGAITITLLLFYHFIHGLRVV